MKCPPALCKEGHHPNLFAQQGRHRDAFYFWSGWSGDDKRDCPTFICRPKVRTGDVMSGAGGAGLHTGIGGQVDSDVESKFLKLLHLRVCLQNETGKDSGKTFYSLM